MAHLELGLEKELVENQTSYSSFYSLFFVDTHALNKNKEHFYKSFISLNLLMADRTEAAAVVE